MRKATQPQKDLIRSEMEFVVGSHKNVLGFGWQKNKIVHAEDGALLL